MPGERWINDVKRDLVIVVCAVSAGIHGGLVREHFAEGAGPGGGFLAATVLLAALALRLTRGGGDLALAATALVLAGLIASYVVATTTGFPVLHLDLEPLRGLALGTKAIEAAGLLIALQLLRGSRSAVALVPPRHQGTLT